MFDSSSIHVLESSIYIYSSELYDSAQPTKLIFLMNNFYE